MTCARWLRRIIPDSVAAQRGYRTMLATPLLREGIPIGVIGIRRTEVRPFTEKQIALLETFADQAVIAIENVRLFKELGERNAELREALEHQTATSEVLGIISRSPTDVQPVLDAIVESAARVCGIDDVVLRLCEGDTHGSAGSFWSYTHSQPSRSVLMSHSFAGCASMARSTFPTSARRTIFQGWVPSAIGAPSWPFRFVSRENSLDTLNARRTEVRPFTPAQIKLLETFADQAVIAIENVRLFQELKESLEQQTATSEILGVIASSPTDIQPVLDVSRRTRPMCDATDAADSSVEGDITSTGGALRVNASRIVGRTTSPSARRRIAGRAIIDRQTIHIDDLAAEVDTEFPESKLAQQRFGDSDHPLRRRCCAKGLPIGVILIRRTEVRPFTEKQIKLLETFASTGRHRHRERAACSKNSGAQRGVARGAGASDGNGRGARHHQPLADGRAAGARRHRRERRAGLWDR